MKFIKVFDDSRTKSGRACLKGDQLILTNDLMGFPAGSRLIIDSKRTIKMRDTFQLNGLLKEEHNQAKILGKLSKK